MQHVVLRRYKRYFQIGGLLIVVIVLLASKSCISDMISYLAYRGGIGTESHDSKKGGKDSADIDRRGDSNSINDRRMRPSYRSDPGSIAREYYESSLYVIAGTVTSEQGSPLAGATVFVPSRWWDRRLGLLSQVYSLDAVPLVKKVCDVDGHYRIVLAAPFKGVLVAEKSGFAQKFEEIEMPFAGVLTKNYQLSVAAACVEGSVSDLNGRPLSGVAIYAATAMDDSSIEPPLVGKSDNIGRYRIDGLPKGSGLVFAIAERHLPDVCGSGGLTFMDGKCARCDFVLKDAVDLRLKIKNREGEAISYANACGKINANEKGEVRLPLPIGTLPFDCVVSALGYEEKHVVVDPGNGVATIILDEGGPAIEGQVVTESGLPVENVKVSVERLEAVYTDVGGRYRIPLGNGGKKLITAYKAGYVESRQYLNIKGEGLTDNTIVLSSAADGIYGRVVAPDGSPVSRFSIELRGGNPAYVYDREFENPNGIFYINDVPAGRYIFSVSPVGQAARDKFYSSLDSNIEIKENYAYGEMYIELQARSGP